MSVNLTAIESALKNYVNSKEGKKRVSDTIKEYRMGGGKPGRPGVTESGDMVVTYDQMQKAAEELIALIRHRAASADIPASVMEHIESFAAAPLVEHDDGSCTIEINMLDNPHRESVQPLLYPRGADNIVATFNKGYAAKGSIRGPWETAGRDVWTRRSRNGLFFIQDAISAFNAKYGATYGVTVTLDAVYEK